MKYKVIKSYNGYGYITGNILHIYPNGYATEKENSPFIPHDIVENNPEYFKKIK